MQSSFLGKAIIALSLSFTMVGSFSMIGCDEEGWDDPTEFEREREREFESEGEGEGAGEGEGEGETGGSVDLVLNVGACREPLNVGSIPGLECETGEDCAEVCCICGDGISRYSASLCLDGVCANADDTCQEAGRFTCG